MKSYTVSYSRGDKNPNIVSGTLEELIDRFSYTLLVGYSYDKKINRYPKTIKSFISNINKAFDIKEGSCYERTSVTLIEI